MARHRPGLREYEDPREHNFHIELRDTILSIALERYDRAQLLSPQDCADLVLAFTGQPIPDEILSWMVNSLEEGLPRGKPRRRLKVEAVLRAARQDYRRYLRLTNEKVSRYAKELRIQEASWLKGEPRTRAIAMLHRKYGCELAEYDETTLERYLRGK